MGRTRSIALVTVFVGMVAASVSAQAPPAPQPSTPPAVARQMDRSNLRRHIYTMEGVLVRAVDYGVKDLNRKLRSAMPEIMALSGEPQARGVYLEGYGIYFDVAVPVLNQVMMWTLRTMLGPDDTLVTAIAQLKSYVQQTEKNPATRAALENSLARLEVQLGPQGAPGQDAFMPLRQAPGTAGSPAIAPAVPASAAAPSTGSAPASPASRAASELKLDRRALQDPNTLNRFYTESVQNALIEAILDHAMATAIRPDEFLTIAARDNMQRDSLAPMDPYEEVVTVLLRVRGANLAAYRTGQIDRDELRRRIEVLEF
jgi:hypothetical protein